MGSISCDGEAVEFDDRVLAHLQIVLVQQFRAGQPVLLSWLDPLSEGDGRSAIWLTPAAILHFKFTGSRSPSIDRQWLDNLGRSASSGPGIIVTNDHGELIRATSHHLIRQPR
ncbi:ATP-dependent DNA ligase [uncultured Amnibacterium sp.]|uniref:DUF7882 family protein n=1 Tax=uncultured Amnibacterium sp. TaxID=1631851 RepID=UPI0035CA13B1